MPSHDDYLSERRRSLEESTAFFAPERKVEREKWVVDAFLKNLGLNFALSELVPEADEPPDIRFKSACFELKELLDSGRRRHQEYRDALAKANAALDSADLLEPFHPREATVGEVFANVAVSASSLLKKYPTATCRDLDLLFYVNYVDVVALIESPFPNDTVLHHQPWRSVSFILGHRSCVLFAREDAPEFLVQARGRIVHRVVTDS